MGRLVLSRRIGEEIVLIVPGQGEISVTLEKKDRDKISVSVLAPASCLIYRREVLDRIIPPTPLSE